MVTVRSVHQPKRPDFDTWLHGLVVSDDTKAKLATTSPTPEKLLIGQEMVEILAELNMDDATLQAALVFPYCEQHVLSLDDISEEFGAEIAGLIDGVRRIILSDC